MERGERSSGRQECDALIRQSLLQMLFGDDQIEPRKARHREKEFSR